MSEKKEKKEKEQKNTAEAEPSRRSRKKQNTHKAILHQAKVLFEKEGIGNVTIEQISESADVSRSTFFSHFASVDDLLKEISDEEINDVFEAARKGDGELTVSALLKQLNDDTYPYPYLSAEVLMRGILSKGESNFAQVDRFLRKEIVTDKSYANTLEEFSSKELSALILGAFFGLIFQKMINDESFTNPDETSVTIQKFIKYLKNQEELSGATDMESANGKTQRPFTMSFTSSLLSRSIAFPKRHLKTFSIISRPSAQSRRRSPPKQSSISPAAFSTTSLSTIPSRFA